MQACSPELFRAVVNRHARLPNPPSNESARKVASLLTQYVELAHRVGDNVGIDSTIFVRILTVALISQNWAPVLRLAFDTVAGPGEQEAPLPETWGLSTLAKIVTTSSSAADTLWESWNNPSRQLGLLERLLFLPPELLNLSSVQGLRRVVWTDDVASATPTIRTLAQACLSSPWNCFELIRTLARLADNDSLANRVSDVFERGIKASPELIFVGLVMIPKPWNAVHAALCARLLAGFLAGSAGHQLVFLRIWQIDRSFLLAAISDFYAENELNVGRIVDIAQDLHVLQEVLELRPFRLALDAAALASRREYLELARWLQTSIARFGAPFVKEALAFVGSKVGYELRRNEMDRPPDSVTMPLIAGAIAIFMRALRMKCVHMLLLVPAVYLRNVSSYEPFTSEDIESFKGSNCYMNQIESAK